ncbi:hypothetical protein ACJJTC_003557 [Scirpophaga incertulas]
MAPRMREMAANRETGKLRRTIVGLWRLQSMTTDFETYHEQRNSSSSIALRMARLSHKAVTSANLTAFNANIVMENYADMNSSKQQIIGNIGPILHLPKNVN